MEEVEIDHNFGLLMNSYDVNLKGFAYWFAENVFESDRISLVASFDMRMGGAKAGSGARFFCRAAE